MRSLPLALACLLGLSMPGAAESYALEGANRSGRVELDAGDASRPGRLRGDLLELQRGAVSGQLRAERTKLDLVVRPQSNGALQLVSPARLSQRLRGEDARGLAGVLVPFADGWTGSLHGAQVSLRRAPAPPPDVEVVLVRGLACALYERMGPTLDENQQTLEARGWSVRRAPVNSMAPVDENASVLIEFLRRRVAAGKRVLLIAHSKGVPDTLTALARAPDLVPEVYGFIAIQSAYYGSPLADVLTRFEGLHGSLGYAFEQVLPLLSGESAGSSQSVFDLDRGVSLARALREPPARVIRRVPTVTVRSHYARASRDVFEGDRIHDPLNQVSQRLLETLHESTSDGMVVFEDQRLPGAWADVVIANLSHAESILRGRQAGVTPCRLTHVALDALLDARGRAPTRGARTPAIDLPLGAATRPPTPSR